MQMLSHLADQLASIRAEQAQERAQFARQLAEIKAEQENEREASRAQIRVLQESLATSTGLDTPQPPAKTVEPTKKKPTLPDPMRFNGDRKEFPAWLLEMRNKLKTDGAAIGNNEDQFAYIFSRLEKGARSMATTFAQSGGGGAFDPSAFLTYLSSCYGDPNLKQRALGRLAELRQRDKESFATFLPKFERELADSGGVTWPDEVRINSLQQCLNQGMTELLLNQRSMPADYLEYIRELQVLGTNLDRKLHQARRSHPSSQTRSLSPDQSAKPNSSAAKADEMDWEATKISRAIQRANEELVGKRAKWVDQAEIDRRRKEGRCLRCGRTGCWLDKCPLQPAKRPQLPARSTAKRTKPVMEAAVEEDDRESDVAPSDQSEDERLKE
jgi:hypothetical protein